MDLTSQVLTFLITIGTGMLLGMLFDCYRVLRGTCNPKLVMTWFTDLLYCLIATVVVFSALVFSNLGELRFYVFIGILSGIGLYYKWLSLYGIRLFSTMIGFIEGTLSLVKRVVVGMFLGPAAYCMRWVSWPVVYVCRKSIAWYRTRTIKPPD